MITTITYTRNIPEEINEQVAKMMCEYAEDLSLNGFKRGQPLYCLDQVLLILEAGTLMSNMGRLGGTNGGLIIAYDDSDTKRVLGFLIYMPLDGVVGECGVNYMAVHHEHRRAGIGAKLITALNGTFRQSTLSCQIDLVPMYEKHGFRVIGHRESHITMTNGSVPSTAGMKIFNPEDVMHHPMLRMAHQDVQQRHSQAEIIREMQVQTSLVAQRTERARAYAEQRMLAELSQ